MNEHGNAYCNMTNEAKQNAQFTIVVSEGIL